MLKVSLPIKDTKPDENFVGCWHCI